MAKPRCLAGVLLLLSLAVPALAQQKHYRIANLSTAVYLAAEFDAATTYHLLQNCGNRCYEANPLMRPFARDPSIFAVMGASAFGVDYLAGRLARHGHPRWAKALKIVAIGTHAGAGVHALAMQH